MMIYWETHCLAATSLAVPSASFDMKWFNTRHTTPYLYALPVGARKSLAVRVRAAICRALRSILLCFFILAPAHFFSMALEADEADQDESIDEEESTDVRNGKPNAENGEEGEASEEEEEDEEPRLKYASLTKHLNPVYRHGDATSAFLVAGDKMVSQLLRHFGLEWKTDSALDHRHTQREHCELRLAETYLHLLTGSDSMYYRCPR